MQLDWGDGLFAAIGMLIMGVFNWLTQRRKSDAETDQLRAAVDDMTWQHAKETIIRLTADVAAIKESRAERDTQIIDMQTRMTASEAANRECLAREEELKTRIARLEVESRAASI